MTESIEPTDTDLDSSAATDGRETVITEALGVIDQALAQMVSRELVTSGEVADLLLDLRSALTTTAASAPGSRA